MNRVAVVLVAIVILAGACVTGANVFRYEECRYKVAQEMEQEFGMSLKGATIKSLRCVDDITGYPRWQYEVSGVDAEGNEFYALLEGSMGSSSGAGGYGGNCLIINNEIVEGEDCEWDTSFDELEGDKVTRYS